MCQENDPDKKETKSSDLQGYWDMMFIQIEDVHNLFEDIDKLRANNWLADETDGIYRKVIKKFDIIDYKNQPRTYH